MNDPAELTTNTRLLQVPKVPYFVKRE